MVGCYLEMVGEGWSKILPVLVAVASAARKMDKLCRALINEWGLVGVMGWVRVVKPGEVVEA